MQTEYFLQLIYHTGVIKNRKLFFEDRSLFLITSRYNLSFPRILERFKGYYIQEKKVDLETVSFLDKIEKPDESCIGFLVIEKGFTENRALGFYFLEGEILPLEDISDSNKPFSGVFSKVSNNIIKLKNGIELPFIEEIDDVILGFGKLFYLINIF